MPPNQQATLSTIRQDPQPYQGFKAADKWIMVTIHRGCQGCSPSSPYYQVLFNQTAVNRVCTRLGWHSTRNRAHSVHRLTCQSLRSKTQKRGLNEKTNWTNYLQSINITPFDIKIPSVKFFLGSMLRQYMALFVCLFVRSYVKKSGPMGAVVRASTS